jgi:hypothetical protein
MQPLSYLIEYNNKIIGVYDNFNTAKLFILSCLQQNFMKDQAIIHNFCLNSCLKLKSKIIKLDINTTKKFTINTTFSNTNIILSDTESSYKSSTTPLTTKSEKIDSKIEQLILDNKQLSQDNKQSILDNSINYDDKVFLDIANQKIELQHKINLLKKQKENMEEVKNVYENDLKMFYLFKKTKESNEHFEIPDLFIKKYIIMDQLDSDNKLTLENFINRSKDNNLNENSDIYKKYFGSNLYEESFITRQVNSNF